MILRPAWENVEGGPATRPSPLPHLGRVPAPDRFFIYYLHSYTQTWSCRTWRNEAYDDDDTQSWLSFEKKALKMNPTCNGYIPPRYVVESSRFSVTVQHNLFSSFAVTVRTLGTRRNRDEQKTWFCALSRSRVKIKPCVRMWIKLWVVPRERVSSVWTPRWYLLSFIVIVVYELLRSDGLVTTEMKHVLKQWWWFFFCLYLID